MASATVLSNDNVFKTLNYEKYISKSYEELSGNENHFSR